MQTDDERSTAAMDWAVSVAQGLVIGGLVLIALVIGYFIVEVGQ